MRVAIIENGKVVNVEMADTNYRPSLGRLAIPSDTAKIGDAYNGKMFISASPSKDELLANAIRRSANGQHMHIVVPPVNGKPSVRVFVAKGSGVVDGMNETTVSRLAKRAEINPNFTVPVPQPRQHKSVALTGAQFIALNEGVTDWYIAMHRAQDSVKNAIQNGLITSHDGVDNPPSNVLPWPKRYWDLSATDRAKEDISAV